jgi:hypothetical protein
MKDNNEKYLGLSLGLLMSASLSIAGAYSTQFHGYENTVVPCNGNGTSIPCGGGGYVSYDHDDAVYDAPNGEYHACTTGAVTGDAYNCQFNSLTQQCEIVTGSYFCPNAKIWCS